MLQKAKIIYNPAAGKGSAGKNLEKVLALLRAHQFSYDLALTEGPGHAQLLSCQAAEAGCPLVIAAGGDGTVNETINGLMLAQTNGLPRPALGVLPIGRGNDFAFGVGIPQDTELACKILANGRRRKIDIGLVIGGDYPEGRYFGNGIGLGFDTVVGFEANKIKWLTGAASYLAALVKTIFMYTQAPIYELDFDGLVLQKPFLLVSIMNGRRMGGAFLMAPDGHPGDGNFDLCLAGQVSQMRILPLALTFFSGSQTKHPAIEMRRARQIRIRAVQGTIPAHADGETICQAGQSLAIELCPGALEVLVPHEER